jgi:hypothetical protein
MSYKKINSVLTEWGVCSAIMFSAEGICLQQTNFKAFDLSKVPKKAFGGYIPPC